MRANPRADANREASAPSLKLQRWEETARQQLGQLSRRKATILTSSPSQMAAADAHRAARARRAALNELLREAGELATRLVAGEIEVEADLRRRVREVAKHTREQLAFEESCWLPALVSAGLWGPPQSEVLAQELRARASTLPFLDLGESADRVTFAEAVARLAEDTLAESESMEVLTQALARMKGNAGH